MAVNESPAPTVSTAVDGSAEHSSSVSSPKSSAPRGPRVSAAIRSPYRAINARIVSRGAPDSIPHSSATIGSSSSFSFTADASASDDSMTSRS